MYYSTVIAYATLVVAGCQPIISKVVMANKGDNLNGFIVVKRGIYISTNPEFSAWGYQGTKRIAYVLSDLESEGYQITRVWNENL